MQLLSEPWLLSVWNACSDCCWEKEMRKGGFFQDKHRIWIGISVAPLSGFAFEFAALSGMILLSVPFRVPHQPSWYDHRVLTLSPLFWRNNHIIPVWLVACSTSLYRYFCSTQPATTQVEVTWVNRHWNFATVYYHVCEQYYHKVLRAKKKLKG